MTLIRPFERTANNVLPQKLENHCITSSLLDHSSYCWSFFELFIWARGLYFHSCPTLSSSPTYALPEESFEHTSHSCKILQKPIGKNVPKLFHTQVFHRISKTKRTKLILQPSPTWEVKWRRHDHNAL